MITYIVCRLLLKPNEIPVLPGLHTPSQFYMVANQPAPLAGMPFPDQNTPWKALYELGFRNVVSLHSDPRKHYNPAPLATLSSVHLEDLFHGGPPDNPQWEEDLIGVVARVAEESLQAGEGVVVHCLGGTGRTGTLIGCLLAKLGCPPYRVIDYLHQLNLARGNSGWPESPWQADMIHKFSALA